MKVLRKVTSDELHVESVLFYDEFGNHWTSIEMRHDSKLTEQIKILKISFKPLEDLQGKAQRNVIKINHNRYNLSVEG